MRASPRLRKPKREWIDAERRGHDVDLRLDRIDVHVRARCAPRADGERMHARCATGRLVAQLAARTNAQVRGTVARHGGAIAGAVHRVVPQCDPARCIHRRSNLGDSGRIERIVEELLGARPGNLHRPAGDLRQTRRLDGLQVRALAAEAAAEKRRDHMHVAMRHAQRGGDAVARRKRRLRRRPDRHAPVLEFGDGRMRLHRRMGDVALEEGRFGHVRRASRRVASTSPRWATTRSEPTSAARCW